MDADTMRRQEVIHERYEELSDEDKMELFLKQDRLIGVLHETVQEYESKAQFWFRVCMGLCGGMVFSIILRVATT